MQQVRDLGRYPKENAERSLAERQVAEKLRRARKAKLFSPEQEAELQALQPVQMKAKCANHERCGSQAKSHRARYCAQCFRDNAARKGSLSSGNSKGKGSPGNAGNVQTASVKKRAGERSGVRRSAKSALVVKRRWLDKILAGRKTWEIRGGPTTKRGWIHFAQSGSTGKLMGRARLVVCHRGSRSSFEQDYCHHCVDSWDDVKYKKPYAWVPEDAERFERPFDYNHKRGAVIFCGC